MGGLAVGQKPSVCSAACLASMAFCLCRILIRQVVQVTKTSPKRNAVVEQQLSGNASCGRVCSCGYSNADSWAATGLLEQCMVPRELKIIYLMHVGMEDVVSNTPGVNVVEEIRGKRM